MDFVGEKLISGALETLIEEIRIKYEAIRGVKEELDKLKETLSLIQDVLEDAEQKQFQDKAVQNWFGKLKDMAYDAEDILDEWATDARKQDDDSKSQITTKVSTRLRSYFDEVQKQSSYFHLMARVANTKKEVGESSRLPTDSLVIESETWGRDEDKQNVIELLLKGVNNEDNVFVLPIVGMGGLGKTTLAQLVFNNPQDVDLFKLRMWVSVSKNFELIRLVRAIFQPASGEKSNLDELDPLQKSLQEKLKGKKFLLVLDDVWNKDPKKWHRVEGILNHCDNSFGKHCIHDELTFTTLQIKRKKSPNLEAIGKQIVQKCGGLPLAVNALGSLLSSKSDEEEWRIIRDSEILKLPNDETNILPALRLSYDHLSYQLKRCFAICSIFPKDYTIDKENLIDLWIANDFILLPKPSIMELEDVGIQIFNELVRRSLLQVEDTDRFGKIISCKMHDLLHDLARYVTGSEFFTLENAGESDGVPKETRHLFFAGKIIPKSLCDTQKLRCLHLADLAIFGERLDFNKNISNLIWLRWLDLSKCYIHEVPSSIGNLLHLRYLNLSKNCIRTLPESVSYLPNLQALILSHCSFRTTFPKGMRKMSRLRHLDITGCKYLMGMPNKIGQMTSLQKLPIFIVGEGSEGGISQLGDLKLIREKLSIMHLERVRNGMEPQEAKLFNKKNLRFLKLSWSEGLDDREAIQSEETLNNLQPCAELEELEIFMYPGKQFSSSWLKASLLPNLVVVDLDECYNCQNLPPLGQLPCLKLLHITAMHAMKSIGVDFYGEDKSESFPSLEEFTLGYMDNLEEWSFVEDTRKVFPCLNKLTIRNLEKLRRFPEGLLRDCTMLKTLKLRNCQKLRTLGQDISSLVALEWITIGRAEQREGLTIDSLCAEMECLSKVGIRGLTCLRELNIRLCALTTISPVLEGLSSLKTLEIFACPKLMSLPEGIGKLIHLEILKITCCESLTSFPQEGIGGLTSLKVLHLQNLPNLTSLTYLPGGLISLQELRLKILPHLTCLPEEIGGWTSLQVLVLDNLPKLTYLPEGIGGLVSLNKLDISFCFELSNVPLILQRLTTLKELVLHGGLKFLPEGGLASLTELDINVGYCEEYLLNLPATLQRHTTLQALSLSGFDSLNFIVEGGFPSLEKLQIHDCLNLTSLPEEGVRGLTALKKLLICRGNMLSRLPAALQQLTSLRELIICDCENLTSLLEEGVLGLTALESLHIYSFKKLLWLPAALQQLTSLRKLIICDCENLTSLPEEGVRGLIALKELAISDCSSSQSCLLPYKSSPSKDCTLMDVILSC